MKTEKGSWKKGKVKMKREIKRRREGEEKFKRRRCSKWRRRRKKTAEEFERKGRRRQGKKRIPSPMCVLVSPRRKWASRSAGEEQEGKKEGGKEGEGGGKRGEKRQRGVGGMGKRGRKE